MIYGTDDAKIQRTIDQVHMVFVLNMSTWEPAQPIITRSMTVDAAVVKALDGCMVYGRNVPAEDRLGLVFHGSDVVAMVHMGRLFVEVAEFQVKGILTNDGAERDGWQWMKK